MHVPTSYLTSTKNLDPILEALRKAAEPNRVTYEFLKQLGFASSTDRPLIPLLKAMRFLDESGTPTDRYRRFRDTSQAGAVMAEALRDAYADVFAINQEAHRLSPAELKGIFARLTGKQDSVVDKMAMTFKAFAARGDFDQEGEVSPVPASPASGGILGDFEPARAYVHPLILGLLRELPAPGSPFPPEKQNDWLEIAKVAFRLIYAKPEVGTAPDGFTSDDAAVQRANPPPAE